MFQKVKMWFNGNVDTKTAVSAGVGVGLFGLAMYGLKQFGGKYGKKVAKVAEGEK